MPTSSEVYSEPNLSNMTFHAKSYAFISLSPVLDAEKNASQNQGYTLGFYVVVCTLIVTSLAALVIFCLGNRLCR